MFRSVEDIFSLLQMEFNALYKKKNEKIERIRILFHLLNAEQARSHRPARAL